MNSTKLKLNTNKPPQVRQTLTSKYRMLKANPLLKFEMEQKLNSTLDNNDKIVIPPLKTLVQLLDSETIHQPKPIILKKENTFSKCAKDTFIKRDTLYSGFQTKSSFQIKTKNRSEKVSLPPTDLASFKKPINAKPSTTKKQILQKSSGKNSRPTITQTKSSTSVTKDLTLHTKHTISTLRKSKTLTLSQLPNIKVNQTESNAKPEKDLTQSNKLKEILLTDQTKKINEEFKQNLLVGSCVNSYTPQKVDTSNSRHTFQNVLNVLTPLKSGNRQTMFATPSSTMDLSKSEVKDIAKKLNEWLKNRGKSVASYHHLNCFGLHATDLSKLKLENMQKENVEYNIDSDIGIEDVNLEAIAREALNDLHHLILDGYSSKQCVLWLKLIKEKCNSVEEEPQYWECRAALEQRIGNISKAVDCYKAAIVQGAEVQEVDFYLDELYKKFNLLNVSESDSAIKCEKSRMYEDMKNVFKSNIIQFAVQERVLKKSSSIIEKKYIATPVRRSTRLSRSAFTSTPGVTIYSSLQDVDQSIKQHLDFQCNKALKE